MSDTLFSILKDKVYENETIREVSYNSLGKTIRWIFDFKSQALSKIFLQEYARFFWDTFKNKFETLQIGGMESGAIPLIAGVALCAPDGVQALSFYIRKSRKKSDLARLIEGELVPDVPIVLIDDILNSGTTARKQIKILEDEGHKVSALFVCLRFRDISTYQDILEKGIEIISIYELDDFKHVLPVSNITKEPSVPLKEKYFFDYKVTLTKKPNLYLVAPKSAPLLSGEYIYMGADDGSFYCLRASDGSISWVYRILFGAAGKKIFSSPVIFGDKVIFGAYDGNLYCLNSFTGKREWVFTDADWIGSSPCIDTVKGIVYVGLEFGLFKKNGGMVAIDIRTGKVKWKNYSMSGLTHASPAYDKKTDIVVCGCNDNCLYAFSAKTGDIVWKFETGGEIKYGAIFDDKRGLVIFGSMDGFVYALSAKNGALYHKFEARFGFYSNPVLKDDIIIIGSLDKIIYCFNLATLKIEWSHETSGRIFSSPIIDDQSVFIGSNDGRLYELHIETGAVSAVIQLSERIVNKIQIGRLPQGKRILYIPTHACELYKMIES